MLSSVMTGMLCEVRGCEAIVIGLANIINNVSGLIAILARDSDLLSATALVLVSRCVERSEPWLWLCTTL